MVSQNIIRFISVTLAMVNLTSCGFTHTFWGEKAPPRKVVIVESKPLPDMTEIFSDNQKVAQETFDQYKASILSTFDQIHGKNNNRLSLEEIMSLGKVGLAKLSDNQSTNLARIQSVLTLLGFGDGISRDQVTTLLDWVNRNRIQSKAFYEILIKSDISKMDSTHFIQLLNFTGSFIALGGENSLSNEQVANVIQPWIPENYTHANHALTSGIDLVISVFSSLCGDRVEPDKWNAKKNGECILSLIDHFQSISPVFDLISNHLNPITERGTLATANSTLVDKVESWMKGHHHPPFLTQKVATFAEQLEIPSPYHFFQLTEWIPKLNAASTEKSFSPSFFIDIAQIIQNWVNTFLDVTSTTKEINGCSFADWKKCEFQGKYDTTDRLFNDEYATLIRTNNLNFVYKISFYDAISDYLIRVLGDSDGLLKDDIKDLITVVVRIMDSNGFAQNVISRIQEKPIEEVNTEKSIEKIRIQGLGELAALASDLIPERGGNKRSLLKKITAQVYDSQQYPSYTLDRLGITTFIYVFDLLGNLRDQYMNNYNFEPIVQGTNTFIKRRKIVELIPQMLHDHFPRIYNECLDWGFERTCGVVYTEILSSAIKGTEVLEPSDLDMLNLTSILLESMMNRCDRNHDDLLSTNILDGFDEKNCVLTVSSTLATRLMRANILADDQKTKTLLNIMKWVAPARWAAKVGLERGTLKGIGWRAIPFISLASGPAKLGGVMSLAAEFMDPAKVDAIEAGIMGHHEDIGDELIYLNQMTDHYLPSHSWALRTSAAARILYGPASVVTH